MTVATSCESTAYARLPHPSLVFDEYESALMRVRGGRPLQIAAIAPMPLIRSQFRMVLVSPGGSIRFEKAQQLSRTLLLACCLTAWLLHTPSPAPTPNLPATLAPQSAIRLAGRFS
jgi:hypothetical protein